MLAPDRGHRRARDPARSRERGERTGFHQQPARVARLCRRSGQLAVRRRDRDHEVERRPAVGRVDATRPVRPISIRSSCAAPSTARGPRNSFVALDAATGKRALGERGRPGIQRARRQLLGEQGRHGSPPDLQREQFAAGARRRDGAGDPVVRRRWSRRPARRPRPGSRRRSTSRAARPAASSKTCIILGSATNQEYASAPGDIRAFDVRTGALVWTFHTVPRPGEFGYDTWPPDAWKTVGGANNWGEQSIDERRGIVYVPTGSPKYNFYGGVPQGREPVRRLPDRARRADWKTAAGTSRPFITTSGISTTTPRRS